MTRRRFAALASLSFGFLLTTFPVPAGAAEKDATGTWKWTVNRNGEEIETVLKLKQEGEKLTGKITGRQGQETEIKDGTVKGKDITFKVEREFNGNVFTINYKGTVDGDAIKGKIEMTRDGETRERDWEAKRSE